MAVISKLFKKTLLIPDLENNLFITSDAFWVSVDIQVFFFFHVHIQFLHYHLWKSLFLLLLDCSGAFVKTKIR